MELVAKYPTAADVLSFYAALAEYQKSLLKKKHGVASGFGLQAGSPARHPRWGAEASVAFLEVLDLERVAEAIPDFLTWLERAAPARLADAVAEMRQFDHAEWRHLLHSYFVREADEHGDETIVFVLEAALQPFAEELAIGIANPESRTASVSASRIPNPESRMASISALGARPPLAAATRLEDSLVAAAAGAARSQASCPICGALPTVGVLREEGQGAKRTLVCALCLAERDYLRVVCLACGEQQFDALPIYTAEQFAHVRIEACESCRHYLKTIDLTKDGLAVPPVDDIASLSLDLWARERGYVRLRPNLLRI
jgi:formate dehydrogenase maturation protein FdhE